jgi:hypothetical protein
VASTTLTDPLAWENSTVLQGDVAEAVAGLKQQDGDDLLAIGSTKLVQMLIEHDLVDEFPRQPGDDHQRDPRDLRSGRGLTLPAAWS